MELSKLQELVASLNQELEALHNQVNTQELLSDEIEVCVPSRNAILHPQYTS